MYHIGNFIIIIIIKNILTYIVFNSIPSLRKMELSFAIWIIVLGS